MTGRAEHARHPRREVITTPIFHIRMPSVGSQGDPPAAEPGCDPRREDGSGSGRRGLHAGPEAAACLRDAARRFRPPAFWSSRHVPGTPFGAAFPVTLTPHPHDRLVAEGRLRLSQSRTARPRLLSRVCPANPRYRGNRLPAPPAAAESAWERPPPVGRGHHSEARPRPPGLFLFRDAAPSSPSPAGTRVSPVPVDRITAAAHQPPRLPPSRRPPQAGARAHKESDRDGALGFSRRSARRRAARRDKTRVSRCLARARAPQRPLGEGPFAARLLLPLPGFSPRGGQTTQAQLPVDPRPSSVPGTAVNTSAREEWACVDV